MQRNFCRSLQIESIALVKVSYVFCKQSYLMQVISLIVKADHKSFNETVKSVLDTEISKITKEDDLIKYNESYLQMHSFSLKAHIAGNQYFQTLTLICFFFFVFFVLPSLNAVFCLMLEVCCYIQVPISIFQEVSTAVQYGFCHLFLSSITHKCQSKTLLGCQSHS